MNLLPVRRALNARSIYVCRSCLVKSHGTSLRGGHSGRALAKPDKAVGEDLSKQLDKLEAIENAQLRDSLGLSDTKVTRSESEGLKHSRNPKKEKVGKDGKSGSGKIKGSVQEGSMPGSDNFSVPSLALPAIEKSAAGTPVSPSPEDISKKVTARQRKKLSRRKRKGNISGNKGAPSLENLSSDSAPHKQDTLDNPQNTAAEQTQRKQVEVPRSTKGLSSRVKRIIGSLRNGRRIRKIKPRLIRKCLSGKPATVLPASKGVISGNGLSREASMGLLPKTPMTPKKAAKESTKEGSKSLLKVPSKPLRKSKLKQVSIETISGDKLEVKPVEMDQPPVPRLAYGLDRVLFNRGVYQLQDPRSRVFNFDPYLQTIMPVSEFDFSALNDYITSSKDASLENLAKAQGKRYVGSTSSMTGMLSQFHYLLSQWREVNTDMLSASFPAKLKSFTLLQRGPAAIFLKWQNGTYAIDADKEFATANILSMLGKSMEKLLTLDTDQYERYRKSNTEQGLREDETQAESYHYSSLGDFLFRSQLDAHDPRLPGTGMFDLKTRAVLSIRMKVSDYDEMKGYEIRDRTGEYESFEREYYDMIRSAFLKYSLQVRMGRMDGIFVAYHNTDRIFGFQYIPIEEMDLAIHGKADKLLGDQEFMLSLRLLNKVLDKATKEFPGESLRLHFETRESQKPFMYIFAEPVSDEQMQDLQSRNDEKIQKFERDVLGLHKESGEEKDESIWEDIQAKVQESIENDEVVEDDILEIMKPSANEPREEVRSPAELISGDTQANNTSNDTTSKHNGEHSLQNHQQSDPEASSGMKDLMETSLDERSMSSANELSTRLRNGRDRENDNEGSVKPDTLSPVGSTIRSFFDRVLGRSPNSEASSFALEDSKSTTTALGARPLEQALLDAGTEEKLQDGKSSESAAITSSNDSKASGKRLLAMTLTIRNKLGDEYVTRPDSLSDSDYTASWQVEYSLAEIPDTARRWRLYEACQRRRKKALEPEEVENSYQISFFRNLRNLSRKGRAWRKKRQQEEAGMETIVLGREKPT